MNDQPATSGFTTGLDRKIEASKRRAAEERAAAGHGKLPTEGLTDLASTANNNIPARKPANITSVGYKVVEHPGEVFERVVFDPPVQMQAGDTIHVANGKAVVTRAGELVGEIVARTVDGDTKAIIKELAPHPAREFYLGAAATINMIPRKTRTVHFPNGITILANEVLEIDMDTGESSILDPSAVSFANRPAVASAGRSRIPIDQVCTVAEAMDRLKLAMQQDPDYARTWHDNIAMAFVDGMRWTDEALGLAEPDKYALDHTRRAANRAAEHLMAQAFEVKTQRLSSGWQNWRPAKNTGIAGSLDAQLAAAKAAEPDILGAIQTIEQRDVARARFLSGMWDTPIGDPAAPGGLNEMKARALERMGFGSTIIRRADGNAPEKADLSDAASMTYTRRLTLDELGDLFPKDHNGG